MVARATSAQMNASSAWSVWVHASRAPGSQRSHLAAVRSIAASKASRTPAASATAALYPSCGMPHMARVAAGNASTTP